MVFLNDNVKYTTIGTGAIDQNGSYKLELFRIKLPIYINIVANICQTTIFDHVSVIDSGRSKYDK